jgi:uncharacterized protein YndB with AHSA1/START domain
MGDDMRWMLPVAMLACGTSAVAGVVGKSDAGFATAGTVVVTRAPEQVWASLVEPRRWWNPEHSWSGKAANLSLEPRAGGCFCEALPGGGSVEHMRVVYADPGHQLRMRGALGPLQGEGLSATLTVTLEPAGQGTKISWSYKVGGYTDLSIAEIAPAVDNVVTEQFQRLRTLVDKGSPDAR